MAMNGAATAQTASGLSYRERIEIRRRKWLGKIMGYVTSMANAWISYISVVLVSIAFSVFYLQSFFYLITILLICMPVISYNLTRYVFTRLEPSLSFVPFTASKGGVSSLNIAIINPTRLPVSCAELTIEISSFFYGGEPSVTHSLQLKSGENNSLSFPVKIEKSGIYNAMAHELTVYDYLHLFTFKRPSHAEATLTVMPDTKPSDRLSEAVYEEGFDEFTDTDRRGNASSNVTDIREYRPGDRMSRIHWKLTEKLDKLIVKENEATSSNEFTVLLELYQPTKEMCDRIYTESGGQDSSAYHTLDRAIDEAWAISLELLQLNETFRFMFYNVASSDFTGMPVRNRDDLTEIMTQAFYAGSYSSRDLALSVYEQAGLNKGTLIHVN